MGAKRVMAVVFAFFVLANAPRLAAQSGHYEQLTVESVNAFKTDKFPLFVISNGRPNLKMLLTNTQDSKTFRIIMTPPDNRQVDGLLTIIKDGKLIATCVVEGSKLTANDEESKQADKTVLGKSLVFGFAVSPEYLAESKFTVFVSAYPPGGMPGFTGYWFYLKDFNLGK